MKTLLTLFLIAATALTAQAADPTADALNATFVENYITLYTGPAQNGKTIVKFTTDSFAPGSPKTVEGMAFRSNGEIAIHIANFNPLTDQWTVESTAVPDVSFTALKGFFDDLVALQNSLTPPPLATPVGGAGPTATPPPLTGCALLEDRIRKAHAALTAKEIEAAELSAIVSGAVGSSGVSDSSGKLIQNQKDIRKNIDEARAQLAAIRSEFGSLTGVAKQQCVKITSQFLIDYIEVYSTAERIIATKEALHKQLGELVDILKPYLDPKQKGSLWRGPLLNDYAITTVTPTAAEQRNVTAIAKTRSIQLGSNNSIVIKTDDENVVTGKFDVRKHSFFVAERAVAMVYNSLTYPDYGTGKNAAGETIIVENEDRKPIDGAMMLNLVMRLGRGSSVAHPIIQLGVSTAKDFPGFLAGTGFRFTSPVAFSLSVGGLITRYKDLDDRDRIGKPVSGTAEIQEHLVWKTSPVALYGALQLKF